METNNDEKRAHLNFEPLTPEQQKLVEELAGALQQDMEDAGQVPKAPAIEIDNDSGKEIKYLRNEIESLKNECYYINSKYLAEKERNNTLLNISCGLGFALFISLLATWYFRDQKIYYEEMVDYLRSVPGVEKLIEADLNAVE